jgi:3-oxoadipate enol-lactonase
MAPFSRPSLGSVTIRPVLYYVRAGKRRLAYNLAGRGPAIVFLHGFGLDHRMWLREQRVLAAQRTTISCDLRGFGFSDLPEPGETYSHTQDLATIFHVLNISQADIVGHSLGGDQALEFALRYPEHVCSLVLVSSGVSGYRATEQWRRRMADIKLTAQRDGVAAARSLWLDHPLFAATRSVPRARRRLAQMIGSYSGWHWLHPDPLALPDPPVIDRLASVQVPTLAIRGQLDAPDTRNLHAVIVAGVPRARPVVMDGAGHMAPLERPQLFHDTLRTFLENPR